MTVALRAAIVVDGGTCLRVCLAPAPANVEQHAQEWFDGTVDSVALPLLSDNK
jgi:hypothetical protein